MKKVFLQMAAAVCFIGAACSPAQALVVGTADSSNGIPFGSTIGGYYYQQVYSAASFAAAIDIAKISFYTSQTPGGTPRTGSFQIYLSTTSAAIGTFDTSGFVYSDPSFVQVFDGVLPVLANGALDLSLSTAFNYNPSAGNLMMTIRSFDFGTGNLFLDTDKNAGVTNSRFSAYPYEWNQGLVTGFNEGTNGAVPEPATWAMMISGFGIMGASMRRKRRLTASLA